MFLSMNRRIAVTLLLIITASPIFSYIKGDKKNKPENIVCEMQIDHSRVKSCCCSGEHKEFIINQAVELPLIESDFIEISLKPIKFIYSKRIYVLYDVSTFFTPLKTIRLLI